MISPELLQKVLAILPGANASSSSTSARTYTPVDEKALSLTRPQPAADKTIEEGIEALTQDMRGIASVQIGVQTPYNTGTDFTALTTELNTEEVKRRYPGIIINYDQFTVITRPVEHTLNLVLRNEDALETAPTSLLSLSSDPKSLSLQIIDGEQYLIAVEHNIRFDEKSFSSVPSLPSIEITGAEVITVYKVTADGKLTHQGAVTNDPRVNVALRDPRGFVARAREARVNQGPDINSIMGNLYIQGGLTSGKFEPCDEEIKSAIESEREQSPASNLPRILSTRFAINDNQYVIPPGAIKTTDQKDLATLFDAIIKDQNRIDKTFIGARLFIKGNSLHNETSGNSDFNKAVTSQDANPFTPYFKAFATYVQSISRPIEALVADRYSMSELADEPMTMVPLKFESKTAVMSFQTINNIQYCIVVENNFEFKSDNPDLALPLKFENAEVMTVFRITPEGAYASCGSYTSDPRIKEVIKNPAAYVKREQLKNTQSQENVSHRERIIKNNRQNKKLSDGDQAFIQNDLIRFSQWINRYGHGVLGDAAKRVTQAITDLPPEKKSRYYAELNGIQQGVMAILNTPLTSDANITKVNLALSHIVLNIQRLRSNAKESKELSLGFALTAFIGIVILAIAIYITVQTAGFGVLVAAPLSTYGLSLLGVTFTATAGVALTAGTAATGAGTYYALKNYRESQEHVPGVVNTAEHILEEAQESKAPAKDSKVPAGDSKTQGSTLR